MNQNALALFNHIWQICAMESEVFNSYPGSFRKSLLETQMEEWKKVCVQ